MQTPISENKQSNKPRRGAPLRNRNAVGHGAPPGNWNAVRTHQYSRIAMPDPTGKWIIVSHGRGRLLIYKMISRLECEGGVIQCVGRLVAHQTFFPRKGDKVTLFKVAEDDPNQAVRAVTYYNQ